jgi:pimeloyl-[acyl-carrier protein] methyl ester esterase
MIKIHQQTFGKGKPIVLVHGWAMNSGIWRRFAEALATHYQVTCIDLPGHGLSNSVMPYTLERISAALVHTVAEPEACWLGWSLGATVVLDIAGRYPDRVNSLILLAGNPSFTRSYYSPISGKQEQTGSWPGMDAKLLGTFTDHLMENPRATLLRFLALQIHGLPDAKTLLKELKSAVLSSEPPAAEILRQGLLILKEADLRTVLSELKIPVAAILGGKDTLVPAIVGRKMQQLLPGLQLTVLDKAGHVPFLSHQTELVAIISRFMEQQ